MARNAVTTAEKHDEKSIYSKSFTVLSSSLSVREVPRRSAYSMRPRRLAHPLQQTFSFRLVLPLDRVN